MRLLRLSPLGAFAVTAVAFKDTSPFFLFSSSSLLDLSSLSTEPVASSTQLSRYLLDALHSCPSDSYILVSQPAVSSHDYSGQHSPASHLRNRIVRVYGGVKHSHVVPEVIGNIDVNAIKEHLTKNCGIAKASKVDGRGGHMEWNDTYPQIIEIDFAPPVEEDANREQVLAKHDSFLNHVLTKVDPHTYTVIYMTTPASADVLEKQRLHSAHISHTDELFKWESEDAVNEAMHTDLKRDMTGRVRRKDGNNDNVPLFEKYNYFSEGMYMGLIAFLAIFFPIYVGMKAVGSVQVSYAAFNKEMGPSAQKKQQQ